jgi:hypothetical protein
VMAMGRLKMASSGLAGRTVTGCALRFVVGLSLWEFRDQLSHFWKGFWEYVKGNVSETFLDGNILIRCLSSPNLLEVRLASA